MDYPLALTVALKEVGATYYALEISAKFANFWAVYWGPLSLRTTSGIPWREKIAFRAVMTADSHLDNLWVSRKIIDCQQVAAPLKLEYSRGQNKVNIRSMYNDRATVLAFSFHAHFPLVFKSFVSVRLLSVRFASVYQPFSNHFHCVILNAVVRFLNRFRCVVLTSYQKQRILLHGSKGVRSSSIVRSKPTRTY